jgi:hypothetical protein
MSKFEWVILINVVENVSIYKFKTFKNLAGKVLFL